jgi:hypothetical protein
VTDCRLCGERMRSGEVGLIVPFEMPGIGTLKLPQRFDVLLFDALGILPSGFQVHKACAMIAVQMVIGAREFEKCQSR